MFRLGATQLVVKRHLEKIATAIRTTRDKDHLQALQSVLAFIVATGLPADYDSMHAQRNWFGQRCYSLTLQQYQDAVAQLTKDNILRLLPDGRVSVHTQSVRIALEQLKRDVRGLNDCCVVRFSPSAFNALEHDRVG